MKQLDRTRIPGSEGTRFRARPAWKAPWAIGFLGFLVAFIGSWVPSFWNDEIATISAANRSPEQLLQLLTSVDAVHGTYYFLMHFWGALFGFSEIAMRIPSAIAVGLACAGTVAIARKLGSEFVALGSGLVLVFLPRMVWAGTEARQSALITLLAVALTLLLIHAWDSGRVVFWVLYGMCAAVGVYVFMFFVLVIAAHVVAALVLRRRVLAVILSALAAGIAASPFLLVALGQKGQVAWIQDRTLMQDLQAIAIKQFFYGDDKPTGNLPPTWVVGAVVVLGVAQAGLVLLGLVHAAKKRKLRTLAVLSASTVLVPIIGLLAVSVLTQPVYVARYLTFTAPMFAILVGLGLDKLRAFGTGYRGPRAFGTGYLGRRNFGRRNLAIAAAILIVASLIPQLTLKSFINEPLDTERHVAALLEADGSAPASIIYERPEERDPSLAYPQAFSRLTDLSLASSPADSGTLWGVNKPVTATDLQHRGKVYFVGSGTASIPDLGAFLQAGCTQTKSIVMERLRLLSYDCR